MSDLTITLPDGSSRSVPTGTTVGGLAADIGRGLAKAAVIGTVNGTERDLVWELADGDVRLTLGGEPTFVSIDDMDGPEWNFTAHSPAKLALATGLLHRLRRRFALGG